MDATRRALLTTSLCACVSACSPRAFTPASPVAGDCVASRAGSDAYFAAAGFDASRLSAVLDSFSQGDRRLHGLRIERDGRLVAERYRTGPDRPLGTFIEHTRRFDACALHDIRSISKSVTALLWGIAAGMGKTPDVDTPVLTLYPQLSRLATGGRERITVRHLLTMSSGLKWNEENYANPLNDEERLYWTGDQPRYVFDRAMHAPAGSQFNYNGGGTALIANLLERAVGLPLADFAEQRLFAPLGIRDWRWQRDHRGRAAAFSGLQLGARDLARIGQLLLDAGRWQGRQVVPASWVAESIAPHLETGDGLHYGYFWWLGQVDAAGARHAYVAGFGNGGQRLYAVPTLWLVVVTLAGNYNRPEQALGQQLFRAVAAAIAT